MNRESEVVLQQLIEVARVYIDVVERREEIGRNEFLDRCRVVLPLIYHLSAKMNLLRNEEGELFDDPEDHLSGVRTESINKMSDFLGDADTYYHVFDPYESNPKDREVLSRSLGNDLMDIYWDFKVHIQELDKRGDVYLLTTFFYWRMGFWIHHGEHLVNAIKALHWQFQ